MQNQSGIFNGDGWVDSFPRCIEEAIRQRERKGPLGDINAVDRIRPAPDDAREFVLVLDKTQPSTAQLARSNQSVHILLSIRRFLFEEKPGITVR